MDPELRQAFVDLLASLNTLTIAIQSLVPVIQPITSVDNLHQIMVEKQYINTLIAEGNTELQAIIILEDMKLGKRPWDDKIPKP